MHILKRSRALWVQAAILSLGLFSAHQHAAARNSDTFVEIKGASLLPPDQSGLQVVQLANRSLIRIDADDIVVREGQVLIRTELAAAAGIPPTQLGALLEVVEAEHAHGSASHGQLGTIASTAGIVAGTLVMSSAMDDLSDDLLDLSTTALDALSDDSAEEALDAEEDALSEDDTDTDDTDDEPPIVNEQPVFSDAPTDGEASESAEAGTAVGAVVQATDPENTTIVYTIARQDIDGAFSVEPSTGVIRVADPSKLDYESNETLDVTIAATDGGGENVEQTVTIALLDDPVDTLATTPVITVSHPEFSSGAFILGHEANGRVLFGHAGLESASGDASIEVYALVTGYLYQELYGTEAVYDLSATDFTALAEINTGELQNGQVTLTSTPENPSNTLQFTVDTTDFGGEAALFSAARVKTVDRDISGVLEATYSLADGTITKLGTDGFTQTDLAFDVGAGDIWHLADVTGDELADLIIKTAGVGEATVYQNLGTAFDTEAMSETLFTGIDLDTLAGGRALDISVREHFSDGNLSVMLLGETESYLYDLT